MRLFPEILRDFLKTYWNKIQTCTQKSDKPGQEYQPQIVFKENSGLASDVEST